MNNNLPELNPRQLKQNYEVLLAIIDENISKDRAEKLKKLYDDLSENMIFAPASTREFYHLAFTGGYCIHVKNVVDACLLVAKNFKQMGGTIDFTKEELVFSALNHDLGKCGDTNSGLYKPQTSDWHKRRGVMFEPIEEITHMPITERSLFLLQQAGVPVTQKEWIAIRCSDGLYDKANENYLKNFAKHMQLDSNLTNIIHWGDHMACRVEEDLWRTGQLIDMYETDKNS